MTGEELATHQLRCLQWGGFVAWALACAVVPLVNMALTAGEKWGPFFVLLVIALLCLGAACFGLWHLRWHRRTIFAYADEQLAALHSRCRRLGVVARCEKDYRPPPRPFAELAWGDEQLAAAQQVVDDMLEHARLGTPVVVHIVDADPMGYVREALLEIETDDTAGMYGWDEEGKAGIFLVPHARYEPKHVLAVLAHEVAHHFLAEHGIADEETDTNEVRTELAAIYLGFGRCLAKGYARFHWEVAATYFSHQVGYFRPFAVRHAIRAAQKLCIHGDSQGTR